MMDKEERVPMYFEQIRNKQKYLKRFTETFDNIETFQLCHSTTLSFLSRSF